MNAHENRATDRSESHGGMDLLRIRFVRSLVLWRGFPYAFQGALLILFIVLLVLGWGLFAPPGTDAKLYAKSNLVNLLIWGLWWPVMVWVAVLFGRAWCMVCPLELVSNVGERLGRVLRIPQAHLPRWLAAGWLILVLYASIQLLVAGVQLHRVPHYTAIFLFISLATAWVTGLLIKHRAFCRGFCPVGLLLGTYGRGSMLAVRAGGTEKCAACEEQHCLHRSNRRKRDGRSCPSLLNPPKLNSNRDCLVCGQCIKACEPDNMQLLLRRPFSRHDAREALASWPVTLFVMLVSGFVLYELCSEWKWAAHAFKSVPNWAAAELGMEAGWARGVWMLFIVPLGTWTLMALAVRALGGTRSLSNIWRQLALPMAVVIAAGHMAKGLAKFVSWGPYLPHALRDPTGLETMQLMTGPSGTKPAAWTSLTVVSAISVILVLTAWRLALRESRLAQGIHLRTHWVALTSASAVAAFLIAGWSLAATH